MSGIRQLIGQLKAILQPTDAVSADAGGDGMILLLLEELNHSLALLNEETIQWLPLNDLVLVLTLTLQTPSHMHQFSTGIAVETGNVAVDPECHLLAMRCLTHLMEIAGHYAHSLVHQLVQAKTLDVLCQRYLTQLDYIDLVEACIAVLHKLVTGLNSGSGGTASSAVSVTGGRVAVKLMELGVVNVCQYLDFFGQLCQRQLVSLVVQLARSLPSLLTGASSSGAAPAPSVWVEVCNGMTGVLVEKLSQSINVRNLEASLSGDAKLAEQAVYGIHHVLRFLAAIDLGQTDDHRLGHRRSSASTTASQREQRKTLHDEMRALTKQTRLLDVVLSSIACQPPISQTAFIHSVSSLSYLCSDDEIRKRLLTEYELNNRLHFLFYKNTQTTSQDGHEDRVIHTNEEWVAILGLCLGLYPRTEVDEEVKEGRGLFDSWTYETSLSRQLSSRKTVSEPSLDVDLFDISKNDMAMSDTASDTDGILYQCSQSLIPSLLELYRTSFHATIRIRILRILCRIMHHLCRGHNRNEAFNVLEKIGMASFVSRILARVGNETVGANVNKKSGGKGSLEDGFVEQEDQSEAAASVGSSSSKAKSPIEVITTVAEASTSTLASSEAKPELPSTEDQRQQKLSVSNHSLTVLSYSLYLIKALLTVLPDQYAVLFTREGVTEQIRRVLEWMNTNATTDRDLKNLKGGVDACIAEMVEWQKDQQQQLKIARQQPAQATQSSQDSSSEASNNAMDVETPTSAPAIASSSTGTAPPTSSDDKGKEKIDAQASAPATIQPMSPSERYARYMEVANTYNDALPGWFLGQLSTQYDLLFKEFEANGAVKNLSVHIAQLKELVRDLFRDEAKADQALIRIVNMLEQDGQRGEGHAQQGITAHEIIESGLVKALLRYLSPVPDGKQHACRLMKFVDAFLFDFKTGAVHSDRIGVLVRRLQEALSRLEPFELVVPYLGEMNATKSQNELLSRAIRIRLVPDPKLLESLKEASIISGGGEELGLGTFVVSVQCIANFNALNDFLCSKLDSYFVKMQEKYDGAAAASRMSARRTGRRSQRQSMELDSENTSNAAATQHNELRERVESTSSSAYSEEDDDEDFDTDEIVQHPTDSAQFERLRKDSSFVYDVNAAAESPTSQQSSSSRGTSSRQTKWSVEFCLDELRIDHEMTLYGALHRFESEMEAKGMKASRDKTATSVFKELGARIFSSLGRSALDEGKVDVFHQLYTIKYRPVHLDAAQESASASRAASTVASPVGGSSSQTGSRRKSKSRSRKPQTEDVEMADASQEQHHQVSPIYAALSPSSDLSTPVEFQQHLSPLTMSFKDLPRPKVATLSDLLGLRSAGRRRQDPGFSMSSYLPPCLKDDHEEQYVQVLQLLKVLYEMTVAGGWRDLYVYAGEELPHHIPMLLGSSAFLNKKLSAKLQRQLSDILIVSSGLVPGWIRDLSFAYGFLFGIQDRVGFLQSVCFGTGRALMRWQQRQLRQRTANTATQQEIIGRLSRQKVRIQRERLLESALKVLEVYGANNKYLMEVEFFDEVGTGLGPTLEFYSLVSRCFQARSLNIWRVDDRGCCIIDQVEYVQPKHGLFPRPFPLINNKKTNHDEQLRYFSLLGRFVAKSLFDFRLIDIPFNAMFLKRAIFDDPLPKDAQAVMFKGEADRDRMAYAYLLAEVEKLEVVDEGLSKSLVDLMEFVRLKLDVLLTEGLSKEDRSSRLAAIRHRKHNASVSDLSLDMVLPGADEFVLVKNGKQIAVTIENVEEYVSRVVDAVMYRGIERQAMAFRRGFNSIFSIEDLHILTVTEIQAMLSSGVWDGPWSKSALMDAIKTDHGFHLESRQITWLMSVLATFDQNEQRQFLQFITGSPKLPFGGFKALTPPLTVVVKTADKPDQVLPSVMTCANYIKLPEYTSEDVLRERLLYAMTEGLGSFHLS